MGVQRWCCKLSLVLRRQGKIEKVMVGPGSRECKAGYEKNNCGELRVRWRGPCALGKAFA